MKKGIVFTTDAVVGILIMLMFMVTTITLLEIQSQTNSTLYLSRLARDVYEVRYYDSSASLPSWLLEGNACDNSKEIGSERAVVYAGGGQLTTTTIKVCLNKSV